jgi:hypothetical protein
VLRVKRTRMLVMVTTLTVTTVLLLTTPLPAMAQTPSEHLLSTSASPMDLVEPIPVLVVPRSWVISFSVNTVHGEMSVGGVTG